MPIMKIIAEQPVRYALDGFTLQEFEPNQFYEVSPHALRGFVRRGWGRAAAPEELTDELSDVAAAEAEETAVESDEQPAADETTIAPAPVKTAPPKTKPKPKPAPKKVGRPVGRPKKGK